MKARTSDPWRLRLITLERAASALEASAKLANTLDEETAYEEAAFAVRTRMRLSMASVEANFHYNESVSEHSQLRAWLKRAASMAEAPVTQASPETREWVAKATAKWPVVPAAPEPATTSEQGTVGERWERGTPHDPRSEQIVRSVATIDFEQCSDSFCFKIGGDGDNGETLMYLLDVHFEREDLSRI